MKSVDQVDQHITKRYTRSSSCSVIIHTEAGHAPRAAETAGVSGNMLYR